MVEDLEKSLCRIIWDTPWFMRALHVVRSVGPTESYIGSGAVRNAVWDSLHAYSTPSFLADVDVPYFDPDDLSEDTETRYEKRLKRLNPDRPGTSKTKPRCTYGSIRYLVMKLSSSTPCETLS